MSVSPYNMHVRMHRTTLPNTSVLSWLRATPSPPVPALIWLSATQHSPGPEVDQIMQTSISHRQTEGPFKGRTSPASWPPMSDPSMVAAAPFCAVRSSMPFDPGGWTRGPLDCAYTAFTQLVSQIMDCWTQPWVQAKSFPTLHCFEDVAGEVLKHA